MNKQIKKQEARTRRRLKIRSKINGTKNCPRLSVFRSNTGAFVQLIDDENGKTIVSANTKEVKSKGSKSEISKHLGKLIAEKALQKNISDVVFDRSGYKYHGRIKAIAEAAREAGLKF